MNINLVFKLQSMTACMLLIFACNLLSQENSAILNGSLVEAKVVSFLPFKPEDHPGKKYYGASDMIQDIMIQITDVFYRSESLTLSENPFPFISQGVKRRDRADELTLLGFHEGVAMHDRVPIGAKLICVVVQAKDFGPPPPDPEYPIYSQYSIERFMLCPARSIFYVLFKPVIFETDVNVDLYQAHLGWAKSLQSFNRMTEDEREEALVAYVQGVNPLLGTHAVHLMARLFPLEAAKRFDEWVDSPGLSPEVRLSIDQELCIRNGKAWGESEKRKQLIEMLERKRPNTIEGTDLMWFQRRASGHWLEVK